MPTLHENPATMTYEKWVAHNSYPDGTWRGLEKCTGVGFEPYGMTPTLEPARFVSIVMLDTREEVEEYIEKHELKGYVPVCVHVVTPTIRGPLSTLVQPERLD